MKKFLIFLLLFSSCDFLIRSENASANILGSDSIYLLSKESFASFGFKSKEKPAKVKKTKIFQACESIQKSSKCIYCKYKSHRLTLDSLWTIRKISLTDLKVVPRQDGLLPSQIMKDF